MNEKAYPALIELLPHRPPMLLLDRVVTATEKSIVCAVHIHAHAEFLRGASVPAIVGLEYMAQAVGAYAGLGAYRQNAPIKIGYLIKAGPLNCYCESFAKGAHLWVHAQHVWGEEALGVFQCHIEDESGERVAEAQLTVFCGEETGVEQ